MLFTSWLRSLPALMVRGSGRGWFDRRPQARAALGRRSHGGVAAAHACGLRLNEGVLSCQFPTSPDRRKSLSELAGIEPRL